MTTGEPEHVPGQLPLLDSTEAAAREVRWIASEARALIGSDDEARRARFLTRKRALLDYLERSTR